MNIILVGFMGSGKTAVGLELSRITGYSFVDTDDIIVEVEGDSISSIFKKKGEKYFRELEQKVVLEIALRTDVIISTGGGVMKNTDNVKILQNSGILIWLKTEPEIILKRTMSDGGKRPLLNVEEPLLEINKLLKNRSPLYSRADTFIDTSYITVGEAAQDICDRLALGCKSVQVKPGGVDEKEKNYEILIGRGTLHGLGARIQELRPTKVAVVSNPTVFALYGDQVESSLSAYGIKPRRIVIPDGEEYKDVLWLYKILGELLSARFDRKSLVIALGGGVIGDITGFAAAIYMRGIRCVQVPTTLLAQVDSSVGGKTGINHQLGKNMIGAFFQPSLVVMDQNVLESLPKRELRAGLAEIIKYGVIWDKELFETIEREKEDIFARGPSLDKIIVRSCQIKAEVVAEDERESGLRAILNYGHTVGHALETLTGYKRYLHGEAIAIGMCVAADLSVCLKLLGKSEAASIRELISSYGLPVAIPEDLTPDMLIEAMALDKKTVGNILKFVLPTSIGSVRIVEGISEFEISKTLRVSGG